MLFAPPLPSSPWHLTLSSTSLQIRLGQIWRHILRQPRGVGEAPNAPQGVLWLSLACSLFDSFVLCAINK